MMELCFFVEGIWNNVWTYTHVDRHHIGDMEFEEKVIKWDLYQQ